MIIYCTATNFTPDKDFYRCANYKNNSTKSCTSHNIKDHILRELVLQNLQQVVSYVQCFEDVFVKQQINDLSIEIELEEEKSINTTTFISKVKKYTEITELTPGI